LVLTVRQSDTSVQPAYTRDEPDLVADGAITIEQAAKKTGMTVDQFKDAVEALKVTA